MDVVDDAHHVLREQRLDVGVPQVAVGVDGAPQGFLHQVVGGLPRARDVASEAEQVGAKPWPVLGLEERGETGLRAVARDGHLVRAQDGSARDKEEGTERG